MNTCLAFKFIRYRRFWRLVIGHIFGNEDLSCMQICRYRRFWRRGINFWKCRRFLYAICPEVLKMNFKWTHVLHSNLSGTGGIEDVDECTSACILFLPVPEDLATKSFVWGLINIYFFTFLKQNMFSRTPTTGVFFICRVKKTYIFLQSCKKICFFQVYGTGGFHNNIYSELKGGPPYSSVVRFPQFSWPLKFSFSILWCYI